MLEQRVRVILLFMIKTILGQLINFLATSFGCKGVLFFVIGPEGSGKTSLSKAVVNSLESSAMVPFSEAIKDHLEKIKESKPDFVKMVKSKMARRSKNIPHCFLLTVLRNALKVLTTDTSAPQVVVVEGFLRSQEQCKSALDVVREFLPDHTLILLEAVCDPEIALPRDLERGQDNDREQFIKDCHTKYFGQLDIILEECEQWSHRIQVSTQESPEKTLENLVSGIQDFIDKVKVVEPKTPSILWQKLQAA